MCKTKLRRQTVDPGYGQRRSRFSIMLWCASIIILSISAQAFPNDNDFDHVIQTTERTLQGGLTIGSAIDTGPCYDHLRASDANSDGKLSPEEFLSFAQASAGGLLDTNEWGMPVTQFYLLPSEYIGIYNQFACGDENFGCPSIVGINIDGVASTPSGESDDLSSQQISLLFQLCSRIDDAESNLTSKPTSSPSREQPRLSTNAPTNSPTIATAATPTESPNIATAVAPTNSTTMPTASTPTNSPVFVGETEPPTMFGPPPCPSLYDATASYSAGDLVSDGEFIYQCRPFPQGEWCNQEAYKPGNTLIWNQAWNKIDGCNNVREGTPEELYYDEWWADLPPHIQDAFTVLGLNQTLWDGGHTTDYDDMAWDELTPEEHEAAILIGYTEEIWCATDAPTASPSSSEGTPTQKPVVHTPAATAPPTLKPIIVDSSKPVGDGSGEEPYSGPLRATFQYEIFNAQNLMAENDTMAVLLETTTEFVEIVVADTFSQTSVQVRAHAMNGGIDPTLSENNQGRTRRRGLRGKNRRRLQVLLQQGGVKIDAIEDIECSDPNSVPTGSSSTGCQKVTAETVLTLVNEPKNSTDFQFQMAVSEALDDPGMTFPPESGIAYAGPSSKSSISDTIPELKTPNNPPGKDPPAQEEVSTPGWVVPLSIIATVMGTIGLLLFALFRVQKRKRNAIEYNSYDPTTDGNDILGGNDRDGSASFQDEVRSAHSKVSSTDSNPFIRAHDVEGGSRLLPGGGESPGPHNVDRGRNPFLGSQSTGSSDVPSGSLSNSELSSSDEDVSDIGDDDPPEISKRNDVVDAEQQAQAAGPKLIPGHEGDLWRLNTLHEVSESELSSASGEERSKKRTSDRSVYRAGVEALVKEACPERYDMIDEMMTEYAGREEVLIGHLSTMLAAKTGVGGASDTGGRSSALSDLTFPSFSTHTTSGSGDSRSTMSTINTNIAEGEKGGKQSASRSALESSGASTAVLNAGGSASAAAVALMLASDSSDDRSSSSSAGSSDWSSDDGFSSIDASSLATSDTPTNGHEPKSLTLESPAVSQGVSGYHGTSNPTFLSVNNPGGRKDGLETSQTDSLKVTRNDLDDAIQAGDWKAVGATATLIADKSNPSRLAAPAGEEDVSLSSHERRDVDELEKLVEAGNWDAVMAAASRFEGGSERDSSSLADLKGSGFSDSQTELTGYRSSLDSNTGESEITAEIKELVKTVVPAELDNLDEMLLQFLGREDELLRTLRTMRDEGIDEVEAYSQLERSTQSGLSFENSFEPTESSMELSAGSSSSEDTIDMTDRVADFLK